MDTLEAVSTIVALWPTSFKGKWRDDLADELEGWDGLERRRLIDGLKAAYQGKRVTLENIRSLKGSKSGSRGSGISERERVTEDWLASDGLLEAFQARDYGDRLMIERLVWSLVNRPGWEGLLSRQAGPAKYWQPWERIEHLIFAATKATADGVALCYPKQRGGRGDHQPWKPPMGDFVLGLPPLPVWFSDDDRMGGLRRISAIADKFGGFKLGSYGRIFNSPEYQAYLADYERRYHAAFERQHGPARDDGELHPPATRPLDIPKNIPPEKDMRAKRKPMNWDGTTPAFRKLIGADTEDATPNQPQSPPTATGDFDGCSDGLS